MKTTVDETAARELELFAVNEGKIYPQRIAIEKNLERKVEKGTYDHSKAWKLWLYWVDTASKMYEREFGGPAFNKATREAVAKSLSDEWYEEHGRSIGYQTGGD